MRLSIVSPNRLCRTPDGAVWRQGPEGYKFFARYLRVFDQVNLIARVQDIKMLEGNWTRVNGENVEVTPIPHYVGPFQYAMKYRSVRKALASAITEDDALLFRSPDNQCVAFAKRMHREGRPYAIEVVSDPYDVFAPGANPHPLRGFFRFVFSRNLRLLCRNATVVSYVTKHALQKRYPPSPNAYVTYYSSIMMKDDAYGMLPDRSCSMPRPLRLIYVGSLSQIYKGPFVLIDAFQMCIESGADLLLTIIGGGKYEAAIKSAAKDRGIAERVCFLGQLSGPDAVRTELDKSDVFVLPSLTEGLPRALIEAMGRGLPVISTTVGGIPELLSMEQMVAPGDAHALAAKILEVTSSPQRMANLSAQNVEIAKEYHDDILSERRMRAYAYLKNATKNWLRKCGLTSNSVPV